MTSRTVLIFIPILLFFAALAVTAVWTERRRSREKEKQRFADEYFLGSRSLSGVVLAMTLVATYGSVSSFVSGPGIAWKLGLGWVVFAAPQIIAGFFYLGLLGKKMALASRASGAITVTGLLEVRFGSRALTVLLSLALLICFCAMMTGQFIGGAAIFAEAAGIDPVLGLLLFGLLTVFYTTFGGFRAVAWTDFVCAVLMIVGMVMLGWAVIGEAGGLTAAMERAAAAQLADPSADLSSSPIFFTQCQWRTSLDAVVFGLDFGGFRNGRAAAVGCAVHELPVFCRPSSRDDREYDSVRRTDDRHYRNRCFCARAA